MRSQVCDVLPQLQDLRRVADALCLLLHQLAVLPNQLRVLLEQLLVHLQGGRALELLHMQPSSEVMLLCHQVRSGVRSHQEQLEVIDTAGYWRSKKQQAAKTPDVATAKDQQIMSTWRHTHAQ